VRHYFGVGDLKLMNGVGSNVQGSKEEMAIGAPCRNAFNAGMPSMRTSS